MNETTQLIEAEGLFEEPTGGFSGSAMDFMQIREGFAAQRTVSESTAGSAAIAKRVIGVMSADEIAQAVLRTIDFFLLPNDVRRSALYDAMVLALLQRDQNVSRNFIRQYEDVTYNEPEPDQRVRAAMRLFRKIPRSGSESPTAYMSEEDVF